MDEVLKRLMAKARTANEQREALVIKRTAIVEAAKQEVREDLNEAEDAEFRELTTQIKVLDDEIKKLDDRMAELAEEEQRSRRTAQAQRRAESIEAQLRVTEHRTYEKGAPRSYFRDLALDRIHGDVEARERLARHAEEVRVEPEYKEYRDLSRADGSGGFFVPPAWLMDQYAELARPSRVTANLFNSQPLPGGTDSINVPKILTGTRAEIQPADNDPVIETDLTDTSVAAPVRTIAGQQDVALQLLEQSPVNFDDLVFRDLLADYAQRLNVQVLSGSGASGQVTGLRTQSGIGSVAITATTVAGLYSAIANAVNTVNTSRYLPPTVIVMHPRRWAWLTAQLDASSRPLVVPAGNGPNNAVAVLRNVAAQNYAGELLGLPVVLDPSIPTNVSTNQDVVLVMRADDVVLYESPVRTRVLPEVLSGNLTVRLQVYGYVAFTAGRFPQSVVQISGAGLVAPTF